jgi:hypothetical protein
VRAVLGIVAFVSGLTNTPDPAAEAAQQARHTEDRFYSAVQACGVAAPRKPPIRAEMQRGIIQYDPSGTVLVFPWEAMDQGTHDALAALAAQSRSGLSGKATYTSIFNELLVAHELGHWLQAGRLRSDRWESEYNANQIMIAFWREHPEGRSTNERLREYLSFVPGDHNPMPPPQGQSDREYFNAHYAELQRSPAYGWYQNSSGKLAMAERPKPRFCELVRRWTSVR